MHARALLHRRAAASSSSESDSTRARGPTGVLGQAAAAVTAAGWGGLHTHRKARLTVARDLSAGPARTDKQRHGWVSRGHAARPPAGVTESDAAKIPRHAGAQACTRARARDAACVS